MMPMIGPMPSSGRRASFLRTGKRANHLKWLLAGIMALGALIGAGSVYNISPRRLLQDLADLGAKDGMLLDGGGSSSMAIGKGAAGVPAGVLYGGWRPVATHFGVRAQRLRTQEHSSSLVEPIRF
jgi:Phosphodiester glycosidase